MCSIAADDALAVVEAGLDALAGEDAPVGDVERLDRVRRLVVAANRIAARLAAAVRDAECHQSAEHDGLKSMRSWLRSHTRVPDTSARQLIENGRALQSLPALEAAFAAGAVTAEAVAAIAPITTPARLTQAAAAGVDVPAVEAELVHLAQQVSHQRLRAAVHFCTARLDPDGPGTDPTEGRAVTLSRLLGGRFTGRMELDELGGRRSLPPSRPSPPSHAAPVTSAPPPSAVGTPWSSSPTST